MNGEETLRYLWTKDAKLAGRNCDSWFAWEWSQGLCWITRNKNDSMDVLPRNFEFTVERNDIGQGRSHKDDFY